MLFDLSANNNSRKIMILDPNYPEDVTTTVIKGNTVDATFTAKIAEHGRPAEYAYQWFVDDYPVSGANGETFTVTGLGESSTKIVYCDVTNKKGTARTRAATLSVEQYFLPVLNSEYPIDTSVEKGSSITSEVQFDNDGNPASYTYQWYKDGVMVEGANQPTYTMTVDGIGRATLYCEVTNSAGTVISRTATIKEKLTIAPDTGRSWAVDDSDTKVSKTTSATTMTADSQSAFAYSSVDVSLYKTMYLKGWCGGGSGSGQETYQVGLATSAGGGIAVGYSITGQKVSASIDNSYDISHLSGNMYATMKYNYHKTTSTPNSTAQMTGFILEG